MSSTELPPLAGPQPPASPSRLSGVDDVRRVAEAASGAAREFCLALAHGVPAARTRQAVNRVLQAWELAHRAEDVLLVTTELVQNVAQHTAAGCELRLAVLEDALLVEVTDADPRPPVMRDHDPRGLGGRGLIIVAGIARRWGWRPASWAGHTGKVVWVELALHVTG